MSTNKKINVWISFDQRMVAEGIAAILAKHYYLHIANITKNNMNIIPELKVANIDFLILEFSCISRSEVEYVKRIHHSHPALKLIIIAGLVSHHLFEELFQNIDGYVLRTCSSDKIILAMLEIEEAGKYLCPQLVETLIIEDENKLTKEKLTRREREILALWMTTNNSQSIAGRLNISPATVRSHLKNIRDKFEDASMIKMMFYACSENLLDVKMNPICPFYRSSCSA